MEDKFVKTRKRMLHNLSIDLGTFKLKSEDGILLSSWNGQQKYVKGSPS